MRLSRQDLWRSLLSNGVSGRIWQSLENLILSTTFPILTKRDREGEVKDSYQSPKFYRQETGWSDYSALNTWCLLWEGRTALRAEVRAHRVELRGSENSAQDLKPLLLCLSGFHNCMGPVTLFHPFLFLNRNVCLSYPLAVSPGILGAKNLLSNFTSPQVEGNFASGLIGYTESHLYLS